MKKRWGGKLPDKFDVYLHRKWQSIKTRCEDPTFRAYGRYGGRGIKLSDEFQDPRVFVEYVRSLPNASRDLQLDRIDNSRGYERGNLRWVTSSVNCNNRDCTVFVTYKGGKIPLADFVRDHTNFSYAYVQHLLAEGKSGDEIATLKKYPKNISYNGVSMSIRAFALKFTDQTPTNVRRLYLAGVSLDDIIHWKKKNVCYVEYNGVKMPFTKFVKENTRLSYSGAFRLYKKGATLDDLVKWRRKDVVNYKGEEIRFKDFVGRYTDMSYVYARELYRAGKSLDEIAAWRCDPSLRRNQRRPEA